MGIVANAKQFLANKTAQIAKNVAGSIVDASVLTPKQVEDISEKREKYLSIKPDVDSSDAQEIICKTLGAVGVEVYQAYLSQLKGIYRPIDLSGQKFDVLNRIRYFDITNWVTDPEEKNLDRLANVYQVLAEEDCNIALIYHRTAEKCRVTLGVVNTDLRQAGTTKVGTYYNRLVSSIRGNFPGIIIKERQSNKDEFGQGIPESLRWKDGATNSVAIVSNLASEKSEDFISQSMEKLLDGIVPEKKGEEYTIVLLAKPINDQLAKESRLFELYSALSPYASWQTNYSTTESTGVVSSASWGMSAGLAGGYSGAGTLSANFGANFARSSSSMVNIGKNEGGTQTHINYGVKHTLDVIETQMKRLEESASLGMWEFAAYVISESSVIANNVAHMYLALTQGDTSYITRAAVNLWDGRENRAEAKAILASIQKLQHPEFGLKFGLEDEWLLYPTLVTPSASLSGKELAKSLNFPRKSVNGLPVLECASFGRNVMSLDKAFVGDLDLGNIYHMHIEDKNTHVRLKAKDLTMHTFITGSTGSGKSNTVYQILNEVKKHGAKFLVIEPAKGEYKNVFKDCADVKVYGTNPGHTKLLRINPFSFPEETHVYEHMDRLVEIFNVCWPMYAAMPAVLKDAVERAYEDAGWDLRTSTNRYGNRLFPTFRDVLRQIEEVMNESQYSADSKGDYKGALSTRLRSLTNGINGMIFSADELTADELFENNVIVDLSRVGSTETKSLIMGLLVMKLQEHRMDIGNMNENLKHVTVLEEAHNLLKRTSTEQSSEGANLIGKSVEMLTNAIAEMRTYGEGFIIADQAPGLLDMAVIRNTNTKIILRLPEYSDRQLVGKASGLNDAQIDELARLEKGVAAVYQNDWVEAVLCKVKHFTDYNAETPYRKKPDTMTPNNLKGELISRFIAKDLYRLIDQVDDSIIKADISAKAKCRLIDYFNTPVEDRYEAAAAVVYELFDGDSIMPATNVKLNFEEQRRYLLEQIKPSLRQLPEEGVDTILCLIMYWAANVTENPDAKRMAEQMMDVDRLRRVER